MRILRNKSGKIVHSELSYKINGILFEARKLVGRYGNEKQYCDAIEHLLEEAGLAFEREKALPASFEGERAGRNKADFIISGTIVLEVKAKSFITRQDYYQTMRYLKALNKKLAILVNMRRYAISPKRVLNSSAEA